MYIVTQDKTVQISHKNVEVTAKQTMYRPDAVSKIKKMNDPSVSFTIIDTIFTTNFLKRLRKSKPSKNQENVLNIYSQQVFFTTIMITKFH